MSKVTEQKRTTKSDQGGPLEKKAHADVRTFDVLIRDNSQGGFIYWDNTNPSNPGSTSGSQTIHTVNAMGTILSTRHIDPVHRQLTLKDYDGQAWKLLSKDKDLDEILTERACIQMCREQMEDAPIEAGINLMKKGPKAVKEAIALHADRYNGVTGDLKELAREMKTLAETMNNMHSKQGEKK